MNEEITHIFSEFTIQYSDVYCTLGIQYYSMFLSLNHQKLDVYKASKELVAECYRFSNHLPQEEKFGMISQIRRAALSVHLNIAEGSSRRSQAERKRYFEISRGSLIEVDAAFDIAEKLNYFKTYPKDNLSISMTKCFRLLCGLITAIKT